MRPDEHQRMFELEDHYWWFTGRKSILRAVCRRHLPPDPARRILDLGCGTGGTLEVMSEFGQAVGLDPFPAALALCRRRGLQRLVAGDATRLPLPDACCDLVTAFDVFEHIDDDAAAFAEAHRVLRPGGSLLLTVPAYAFLWSEHDIALQHFRRYTRGLVGARLAAAGLTPVRLGYCITFLLPVATALRLLQRLRPPRETPECGLMPLPRPLNQLCRWTLEVEARLLPALDAPCGVSVIALARRA